MNLYLVCIYYTVWFIGGVYHFTFTFNINYYKILNYFKIHVKKGDLNFKIVIN